MIFLSILKDNIVDITFFQNQLAISTTLLGLLIAISTFILQSGFASFSYSRPMFLKYYVRLTSILFLLLFYNTIQSSNYLYLEQSNKTGFYIHVLISIFLVVRCIRFYRHKAYIITLHSKKFNPYKKEPKRLFRDLKNLTIVDKTVLIILVYGFCIFPVIGHSFGTYINEQIFLSIIISFSICIIVLIQIIPTYFKFSEMEYEQQENNELENTLETDVTEENKILVDQLIKNGRKELIEKQELENYIGNIKVELSTNKQEAFFLVYLKIDSTIFDIVDYVETYTYNFFKEINESHVGVNNFVLSYSIKVNGSDSKRNYFIRSKRTELDKLFSKNLTPKEFCKEIENKVLDPIFRGI